MFLLIISFFYLIFFTTKCFLLTVYENICHLAEKKHIVSIKKNLICIFKVVKELYIKRIQSNVNKWTKWILWSLLTEYWIINEL